jgi:hypothetical protein
MIQPHEDFKIESQADYECLRPYGIILDTPKIQEMAAMDALQVPNTTPSIAVPVQFLQNWLPGAVYELTSARLIDEFVGIMTTGQWSDEQIVQQVLELDGLAVPYGDYTNVTFAKWNANYNYSTVVRFQQGMRVGVLEADRSSRANISADNLSRQSAILGLEIARNNTGWFGYNNGANNTYGLLNAPGLPSYVTVPPGASSLTTWASKTFNEIQQDIINAVAAVRIQSQEQINPESILMVLGLATNARDQLSKSTTFGSPSVMEWLNKTYPKIRVVSAPQLNLASGGLNVGYLYAETTGPQDMSTDGKAVFIQCVPAKFKALGVKQDVTYYKEAYSNATAGIMCKRPFAVYRFNGI